MASEVVLDSSALVAMISGEAGAEALLRKCAAYDARLIGAPTFVESAMVLISRKKLARSDVVSFLDQIGCTVISFSPTEATEATIAFERFGRGRHSAGLNLGDCFSYALAKLRNAPLLFVGDDFSRTDVEPA